MASPTFDETYNDLVAVCKAAQSALFECGRLRGRNDLTSDEDLRQLVLSTSKAILDRLPCLQLECDVIEQADSRYGHVLNTLENAEGLDCTDRALAGQCDECREPCDVRDGKGAV